MPCVDFLLVFTSFQGSYHSLVNTLGRTLQIMFIAVIIIYFVSWKETLHQVDDLSCFSDDKFILNVYK